MKRRTFLQALTAIFTGLLTWSAPKIERVAALPRQILEVPKKVQRYFVETKYAERVITPVEEFEKVPLGPTTIKRWDLNNPMMAVPMDVEVEPEYAYVVGRVLNPPGHRRVNIANSEAFDEAVKHSNPAIWEEAWDNLSYEAEIAVDQADTTPGFTGGEVRALTYQKRWPKKV